jgi:hypothetical protein
VYRVVPALLWIAAALLFSSKIPLSGGPVGGDIFDDNGGLREEPSIFMA